MGRLLYNNDNKATFDIDDELLVSLELAISNKLRRSESFMLTVATEGMGHRSLWIAPSVPITLFTYGRLAKPNRDLVHRLIEGANSPDGLDLRHAIRHGHPAAVHTAEDTPSTTRA